MASTVKNGIDRLRNGNQHRRTDKHMGRCDSVPFLRAKKKHTSPPWDPDRFFIKFPRMGKAIEVKCPTYICPGVPPPLGLNIDIYVVVQFFYLVQKHFEPVSNFWVIPVQISIRTSSHFFATRTRDHFELVPNGLSIP